MWPKKALHYFVVFRKLVMYFKTLFVMLVMTLPILVLIARHGWTEFSAVFNDDNSMVQKVQTACYSLQTVLERIEFSPFLILLWMIFVLSLFYQIGWFRFNNNNKV